MICEVDALVYRDAQYQQKNSPPLDINWSDDIGNPGADLGFKEGGFELTTSESEVIRRGVGRGVPGACSPREVWKLGPHDRNAFYNVLRSEWKLFNGKIHLNFALTSTQKKKNGKKDLLKLAELNTSRSKTGKFLAVLLDITVASNWTGTWKTTQCSPLWEQYTNSLRAL